MQIPSQTFDKRLEANDLFEARFHEPIAGIESMAVGDDVALGWNANTISLYNQGLQNGMVSPIVTGDMLLVTAKIPIPRHLLIGVLDAVRNRILDLALQLEKVVPNAGQTNTPDAEQGLAAMIINNHFHASANVAIGSADVEQSINLPVKGDIDGLVSYLRELGLTPEILDDLRAAAKADEEDQGEGRRRGPRVRGWLARVATDSGTQAIGGAVAQAATSFLGG